MTDIFDLYMRKSALVVSCPHPGTDVPPEIRERMTEEGLKLTDTDWHVDRLYDFLGELDATFIRAKLSRYVVDLNRDPEGHALYPGRFETAMCPATTFVGDAIYKSGQELRDSEISDRRTRYWRPYHAKFTELLAETKARHGYVLLLDVHSILSRVPTLFEGRLPDLNLGTMDGKSCAADLQAAAANVLGEQSEFSFVANGRFKGGYITRHYGNPAKHIHALQLEIAMCSYLDEGKPSDWGRAHAEPLRTLLRAFLVDLQEKAARKYRRAAS